MPSDEPRRLALDIETISPELTADADPDWEDPTDFELAAIGFAYDGPEAGGRLPRTQVLLRRAPGSNSEFDLLSRIRTELWSYAPDEIVTFGGDFFDIPMLKQRPNLAVDRSDSDALTTDITSVIERADSVDLSDPAAEAYEYGVTLEDLIRKEDLEIRHTKFNEYDHDLDLDSIRPRDAEAAYLDSSDIPGIMETWLHARSDTDDSIGPCNVAATEAMIRDYIIGDIEHLLTLADKRPFNS